MLNFSFRRFLSPSLAAAMALGVAGAGCGSGTRGGDTSNPDEGAIQLALMNAPSDALCLKVTVESSRNLTKLFDLIPGRPPSTSSTVFRSVARSSTVRHTRRHARACRVIRCLCPRRRFPCVSTPAEIAKVTLKLIRNGRISVGVDFEPSPGAYLVPSAPGVQFKDIVTAGDLVGGYRMAGTPDGLGAFDNGDDTFTVVMGHEFEPSDGIARAHGAKGSFLSRWVVRKSDLTVLSGEDLIKQVVAVEYGDLQLRGPGLGRSVQSLLLRRSGCAVGLVRRHQWARLQRPSFHRRRGGGRRGARLSRTVWMAPAMSFRASASRAGRTSSRIPAPVPRPSSRARTTPPRARCTSTSATRPRRARPSTWRG